MNKEIVERFVPRIIYKYPPVSDWYMFDKPLCNTTGTYICILFPFLLYNYYNPDRNKESRNFQNHENLS